MDTSKVIEELIFKSVRSSGAGGQHVNKVASKVMVHYNINASEAISEEEKVRLLSKLGNKLSKEGVLVLSSSETRSQHKNKDLVIKKLLDLLRTSLEVKTPRKKTKRSRASIMKRLETKSNQSLKKQLRQKPKLD